MSLLCNDGKKRCFGGASGKAFYAAYHDFEWGIPEHDEHRLFEMLVLEGAQAGLSWETVLNKREAYREAFHQFDPAKTVAMQDKELDALCLNPEVIRNRRKIYSARQNAAAFLKIQQEFGSFDRYLWGFVAGAPIINQWRSYREVPASTPESEILSKDLKRRGMNFVGPTIVYAFMQAVGMVDDHLADCWRRTDSG